MESGTRTERNIEEARPLSFKIGQSEGFNCESCSCDNSDSGEYASGDSSSACPSSYLPRKDILDDRENPAV